MPSLALIVPFYNEERYLPTLIASLRAQRGATVPVVFVDNASTDGSAALLHRCHEIGAGDWIAIREPRVGKFYAMRTGLTFCVEQLGARHVGFLDADSYAADGTWLHNSVAACRQGSLGYAYSPCVHFCFERLPTLAGAYRACDVVMRLLIGQVGWFGNSAGAVYGAELLAHYFATAAVTTEIGLRCSLLALAQAREARLNPTPIMTSVRRIVANADNLRAWCFYERAFYLTKDINAPLKLDIKQSTQPVDLSREDVPRFFARQAVKCACRNLIPLALFDASGSLQQRITAALGIDAIAQLMPDLQRFRGRTEFILADHFELMLDAIARHPASAVLVQHIERLMVGRYTAAQPAGPDTQLGHAGECPSTGDSE
ncbi:MAG TPA: glycosyltransferase family A protein [Candidatus Acidoferrales bacterium]|nr:glycosyltransferase family A protein [Candidatus Acidoferrales bacterium]